MAASTAAGKQRIPKVAKVGFSGDLKGGDLERGSPSAAASGQGEWCQGKRVFVPVPGEKRRKGQRVVGRGIALPRCTTFVLRRCFCRGGVESFSAEIDLARQS
jgi:hypothetical protein